MPGRLQGDRVRAYHQIRILSRRHRITLITFAGPRELGSGAGDLEASGARVVTVPLSRIRVAAALVRGGLSRLPLQVALYEQRPMQRAIREALRQDTYDLAHVQLARMGPYLSELGSLPRVVDLVDAVLLHQPRSHALERFKGPAELFPRHPV